MFLKFDAAKIDRLSCMCKRLSLNLRRLFPNNYSLIPIHGFTANAEHVL